MEDPASAILQWSVFARGDYSPPNVTSVSWHGGYRDKQRNHDLLNRLKMPRGRSSHFPKAVQQRPSFVSRLKANK
eukprot:7842484-Lingulodinium_polyedra.AAC.1